MITNYQLYFSLWYPLEDIRVCIENNRQLLKDIIDFTRQYGDEEGVIFFELTEDALRNLPVLMVNNMKCFTKENINTMVFSIKEIKCEEKSLEPLKNYFEEISLKLVEKGFGTEILIIGTVKIEEENIGKTVGKKDYKIFFHGVH